MVKFLGVSGNRKVLGLGLSRANLENLIAEHPIAFSGEQISLDGLDVIIFFGETEAEMEKTIGDRCSCRVSRMH